MEISPNLTFAPDPPHSWLLYSRSECRVITLLILLHSGIGAVTNLTVLVTYWQRPGKQTSDYLFLYLTGVHLFACVVLMPMELAFMFWDSQPPMYCNQYHAGVYFTSAYLELESGLTLLLVAVDRYLNVILPIKREVVSPAAWVLAVLLTQVVSAAIGLGLVLKMHAEVAHLLHGLLVSTVLVCITVLYQRVVERLRQRRGGNSTRTMNVTYHIGNDSFTFLDGAANGRNVETTTSTDLNSIPADSPTRAQLQMTPRLRGIYITPSRQEQMRLERTRRVTQTVITITVLYVVCFVPGAVLAQLVYWRPKTILGAGRVTGALIRYLQLTFHVNFSFSPLVYALMTQQFRGELSLAATRVRRGLLRSRRQAASSYCGLTS